MRYSAAFRSLALAAACLSIFQIVASGNKKATTYQTVMMGEMIDTSATQMGLATAGGSQVHLGFTAFQASNGARLTLESGEFSSADDAKRYFNYEVQTASKVVRRGKIFDRTSKTVGYRAEIIEPEKAASAVIRTNGTWFYGIVSTSLADCLEFESQHLMGKKNGF